MKYWILSVCLLSLFGCSTTPPTALITQPPANDITLAEASVDPLRFIHSPVRWGGRILKVEEKNSGEQTVLQLEIIEYPLDDKGKPTDSAKSAGRFIARVQLPEDKSRYYRNRLVTIAGTIVAVEHYSLASGEQQQLPVVASTDRYAWSEEYRDDDYYYHPWPRFFYQIGIGTRGSGIGIIFH
jgi:outer membrane lipoprotein